MLPLDELAEVSGLLSLNPSDLVFESSQLGISYYDFVLSFSRGPDGVTLYLAKFDAHTNLESFESVHVPEKHFKEGGLPNKDLVLITLGVLTWKREINRSRLLCLVREMDSDCTSDLEALKRATSKFKCLHHVQTVTERRRDSNCSTSSNGSSSNHDSMRLRVLMCQSRSTLDEVPSQALRETRALHVPSSNPLLCLCFPLS